MNLLTTFGNLIWRPKKGIHEVVEANDKRLSLVFGTLVFYLHALVFTVGIILGFEPQPGWFLNLLAFVLAIPIAYGLFYVFNFLISWVGGFMFDERLGYRKTLVFSGLFFLARVLGGLFNELLEMNVYFLIGLRSNILYFLVIPLVLIIAFWKIILPIMLIKEVYYTNLMRAVVTVVIIFILFEAYMTIVGSFYMGELKSDAIGITGTGEKIEDVSLTFGSPILRNALWFRSPTTSDLIGFWVGNKKEYARIVGMPRQRVEMQNGRLYLDGQQIEEPYVIEQGEFDLESNNLGWNEYLLLPDNRSSGESYVVERDMMIGVIPPFYYDFIVWLKKVWNGIYYKN